MAELVRRVVFLLDSGDELRTICPVTPVHQRFGLFIRTFYLSMIYIIESKHRLILHDVIFN